MIFIDDIKTALLGTATLVLFSLYTLYNCRSQIAQRPATPDSFLFGGLSRQQSLAGTIGYAFSLTYFGATVIYGYLFGGWFLVFLVVVLFFAIALTRRVIACGSATDWQPSAEHPRNLLLSLLKRQLGERQMHHILGVYVVIYFALLVEELAVSRVVLGAVFPAHPAVGAVILATICVVILAYVKWGGFRAVLVADFEQLKLLLPFVLALVVIAFHSLNVEQARHVALSARASGNALTFGSGAVMLVAWIVASVDFYSRLNYVDTSGSERRPFATLALTLASGLFIIGAVYGMCLPNAFGAVQTPRAFTEKGVQLGLTLGSRWTAIVFFASLFCMIFSTVNTLLITLFQLGGYRKRQVPHVRNIHFVMLWAMLLSVLLWPNSVSAVGLYICALMIVPLFSICAAVFPWVARLMPQQWWFVWPAIIIATGIFVCTYTQFEASFERMPLLGVIVFTSTVCCALATKLGAHAHRALRGARHG